MWWHEQQQQRGVFAADPVAGAGDGGPEARVRDGARGLPGHHPPAGAAERAAQRDHREGAQTQ